MFFQLLKSSIIKIYFRFYYKRIPTREQQISAQKKVFTDLMKGFSETKIGKDFHIKNSTTEKEFSKVSILFYDDHFPYIEEWSKGTPDVMWKGLPRSFALTSGTSSNKKFIPLTKDSIRYHFSGRKRLMAHVIFHHQLKNVFRHKALLFSDSPRIQSFNKYKADSISSILVSRFSRLTNRHKLPGSKSNKEKDLAKKLDKIAIECSYNKISFAVAMPVWMNAMLEKMEQNARKCAFEKMELVNFSGMNPINYIPEIENKIQRKFNWMQSYPASEGFFGFSTKMNSDDILLLTDQNIYFEFVKKEEVFKKPLKLNLCEVEMHTDYALLISSNNGLLSYCIGDVVEFTNLNPFCIRIKGRISEYIDVVGEHLELKSFVSALKTIERENKIIIHDFLVYASKFDKGFVYTVLIESDTKESVHQIASLFDAALKNQSVNYEDYRNANFLYFPIVKALPKGYLSENFINNNQLLGLQSKPKKLYSEKPAFIKE